MRFSVFPNINIFNCCFRRICCPRPCIVCPPGEPGPQGPPGEPGPQGPPGPPGPEADFAFGGMYSSAAVTQTITSTTPVEICLPNNTISNQVIHNITPCYLEVGVEGVYKFNYRFTAMADVDATITVTIYVNSGLVNTDQHFVTSDVENNLLGFLVSNLNPGDRVSMGISATVPVTLNILQGINAYLFLKMIGT